MLKFDRLNRLEDEKDYFEPMAISTDDKEQRRALAGLLADVFIYFFALYDVHRQYDNLLDKAKYDQLLADRISDAVSKVTGIDAYISNHIRTLADEVVDTTLKNANKKNTTTQVRVTPPDNITLFSDLDNAEESLDSPITTTSDSHIQADGDADVIGEDDDEVEEMMEREAVYNYWLSINRAINIAQNEANTILNYTNYMDAKDRGCQFKTWLTMLDNKVRDTHEEIEGQKIGIDEYFVVGNSQMRFPHDLELAPDPEEVINCRCAVDYE